MEKIRLGIIGIGNMGSAHARSVVGGKCPDFELVAVADQREERLQWAKEKLGEQVQTFSDYMQMLDSGLVDACIVAVPHYDHPACAIACMKKGIHVLVEKPAGVYTQQVMEMNAEADKHPELKFAMMFNQRTNHIYRKIHELVQSGVYGQIRRTNWIITNWYRPQAYYDSGVWRATWAGEGGGVLLNQCPHQLDLWQWICGMPTRVHAFLHYGKWHDIEVEDDVTAYVEYENGATGVFITTTGDGKGSNRLEIQLDKAKIVAEEGRLEIDELEMSEPDFSRTNTSPFGSINTTRIDVETDGKNEQHPGVINAWGGAILRGEPMVADGREGINGLTISNAMHLSSWLNKTVELPLDSELYHQELMKRVATSRKKDNVKTVVADTSNTYGGAGAATDGEYKKRWDTNW